MKNKLTETKFKSAFGLTCHSISRAVCFGAVMLICSSALAQNPAPLEPGSKSLSHLDSGTWTVHGQPQHRTLSAHGDLAAQREGAGCRGS